MSAKKRNQWECKSCSKKYINYTSFNIHMKSKHQKNIKQNYEFKVNFSEEQKSQLQDKIVVLLGEIGEKNTISRKKGQISTNISKTRGRSSKFESFPTNLIVRNPYQDQINAQKQFPQLKEKQGIIKILHQHIKAQIEKVYQVILTEKSKWQLYDPLQDQQDPQSEFSLMDIPLLCKNLTKKKIDLNLPQISIFLLWLSKSCKATSWQFFIWLTIFAYADYQIFLDKKQQQKCLKNWTQFAKERKPSDCNNYKIDNGQLKITNADQDRFLQLYFRWVEYFDMLPINCKKYQHSQK